MNVKVDQDICISNGSCLRTAPEAFRWNAFGVAEVVDPPAAGREALDAAVLGCPSGAITLEEHAEDER